MKKESSIKKKSREFIAMFLTVISLFYLFICTVFFIHNYRNIASINEGILSEFHTGLDADLYNTQQYVISIYANNTDFRTLVTGAGGSFDIYERSLRIKNIFDGKTGFSAEHFGFFIQRDMKNGYHSSYPLGITPEQQVAADRAVKTHLKGEPSQGIWNIVTQDDNAYLILSYRRGIMTVGAVLDLNWYAKNFTGSTTEISFYLGDTALTESQYANVSTSFYYVVSGKSTWSVPIRSADGSNTDDFRILTVTAQDALMIVINMLLAVFFIFLIVIILLAYWFEKKYYSAIIYPIQQMSRLEESLRRGDADKIIRSDIIEYNQINEGMRSLVNQVSALEKENHEKEMAYQRSQLQYYQLQTEPHFFLNCLKNIYALAEKRQFEKIQYIVTIISQHFRYVFRSNTLEIPLKEELEETDCYFRLCQFSSPAPMILEIHRDEALEDCKVPPLLVQTFVENSIKYGKQPNRVLRISVEVSSQPADGNVRILITDCGPGYSPEIIRMAQNRQFPTNGHIGMKNAMDRIMLLYEGRADIRISNNETGGARTEILIPLLSGGSL